MPSGRKPIAFQPVIVRIARRNMHMPKEWHGKRIKVELVDPTTPITLSCGGYAHAHNLRKLNEERITLVKKCNAYKTHLDKYLARIIYLEGLLELNKVSFKETRRRKPKEDDTNGI